MSTSIGHQWQTGGPNHQFRSHYHNPSLSSGIEKHNRRVSNDEVGPSLDHVDFEALLENALLKVVQTRLK